MNEQTKPEQDSSLKKRIDQDSKEALKKKDSLKLSVLRMLKSDIGYKEKEKGSRLSDDDVISLLSSSIKRRKDSIEQFEKGGREDLVAREKAEMEVVSAYLPEQLNEEDLAEIIKQVVAELKATGPSDLGTVMREVMPKVKGRADGKVVNQMVSSQLQKIGESQD
jgi:uncharacterized protein YqeY